MKVQIGIDRKGGGGDGPTTLWIGGGQGTHITRGVSTYPYRTLGTKKTPFTLLFDEHSSILVKDHLHDLFVKPETIIKP